MELLPIGAIQSSAEADDFFRRKKKFVFEEDSPAGKKGDKKTDYKVLDLALEKISAPQVTAKSSLFATASMPNIVFGLISDFSFKPSLKRRKKEIQLIKEKKVLSAPNLQKDALASKTAPIGIPKCEYNSWINALMQFIIFIPSLSEMFAYTPKSLSYFIEFIDQYRRERLQGRSATTASSPKLLESLRRKFQLGMHSKNDPGLHLYEIIELLMKTVSESLGNSSIGEEGDLLALQPDFRIVLDANGKDGLTWEEKIEKHFKQNGFFEKAKANLFLPFPSELLIAFKGLCQSKDANPSSLNPSPDKLQPKKQFFLSHLGAPCALYELDAFIEYRPDGWEKGDYMTYLKSEGEWLQCDDTRIIPLRPINMAIPLRRSFLFHFRKVRH